MLEISNDRVSKNLPITHRIAEHQEQYLTLPANIQDNVVAYSFKLKFKDLLKVIFKRRIYFYQVTFKQPMQPIHVNVDEKNFEEYHEHALNEFNKD